MTRWVWIFAGLGLLCGCGTLDSMASGCAGPWSGVRYDRDLLGASGSDFTAGREVAMGIDGWLSDAWDGAMLGLDLPLSAVADTLVAPVTLAVGQRTPDPVGLGCRWSVPQAYWGSVAAGAPDSVGR